jgi:hypothetical protein
MDEIWFGMAFVIALLVALWPAPLFRLLAYAGVDAPPGVLKLIRLLAVLIVLSVAIEFIRGAFP